MESQYLHKFQQGVKALNSPLFKQQGLELKVGVWLNSVALKIQKKEWLNPSGDAKPFEESVFFSIWINEQSISDGQLHYNIHALKLRELSNYKIKSRDFAQAFRLQFKPFESHWPNVSTAYGPLTLMEGWVKLQPETFNQQLISLANNFLPLALVIDHLLQQTKK